MIFEVNQFWKRYCSLKEVENVSKRDRRTKVISCLVLELLLIEAFEMCWNQHLLQFLTCKISSYKSDKKVSAVIWFRCSYSLQPSNLFWSVALFPGNMNDWISWSWPKLCIELFGQTVTDCLSMIMNRSFLGNGTILTFHIKLYRKLHNASFQVTYNVVMWPCTMGTLNSPSNAFLEFGYVGMPLT